MEQFPSNAQKDKEPAVAKPGSDKEEPKVGKVVEGKVVRQKKSFGRRLKEFFKPNQDVNVGEYVLFDVLIPAAKDMIVDAVQTGVERKFYGEVRPGTRRPSSRYGSGHTPYHTMAKSASSRPDPRQQHGISKRGRQNHDFDDIVLESRAEADYVLSQMVMLLDKFEVVSVSDLYNLVGENPTYIDRNWGWVDLYGASTQRMRGGGYLLNLPRPEPIN